MEDSINQSNANLPFKTHLFLNTREYSAAIESLLTKFLVLYEASWIHKLVLRYSNIFRCLLHWRDEQSRRGKFKLLSIFYH